MNILVKRSTYVKLERGEFVRVSTKLLPGVAPGKKLYVYAARNRDEKLRVKISRVSHLIPWHYVIRRATK